MWDILGTSLSVSQRDGNRNNEIERKTEWELRREVPRDSVRAAVYSGMTARYTVDRVGKQREQRGRVNEYYEQ